MDNIRTIPCPDGIQGCLVLHYATEEVATHDAESKNIGEGIINIEQYAPQKHRALNEDGSWNAINVTNNKCNCFAELSSMTTTEATLIKNGIIKALYKYDCITTNTKEINVVTNMPTESQVAIMIFMSCLIAYIIIDIVTFKIRKYKEK